MKSVVVFGKAQPVAGPEKKRAVLKTFARKYYPNEAEADEEIEQDFQAVQMFEM